MAVFDATQFMTGTNGVVITIDVYYTRAAFLGGGSSNTSTNFQCVAQHISRKINNETVDTDTWCNQIKRVAQQKINFTMSLQGLVGQNASEIFAMINAAGSSLGPWFRVTENINGHLYVTPGILDSAELDSPLGNWMQTLNIKADGVPFSYA